MLKLKEIRKKEDDVIAQLEAVSKMAGKRLKTRNAVEELKRVLENYVTSLDCYSTDCDTDIDSEMYSDTEIDSDSDNELECECEMSLCTCNAGFDVSERLL